MAANKWTIKNYNAYIREARRKGLDIATARSTYRQQATKLGRPAFAKDIKLLSGKQARAITARKAERVKRAADKDAGRRDVGVRGGGGGGRGAGPVARSLAEWNDLYDAQSDMEYDYEEYDSSADYGKAGE